MRVDEKGAGSEGMEEAVEAIRQQWRDRLERRRRQQQMRHHMRGCLHLLRNHVLENLFQAG